MPTEITHFDGQYAWLSNFSPHNVQIPDWGINNAPTAEHAFQAMKTIDAVTRQEILEMKSPGHAKRAGRTTWLRPNWEEIKLDVMRRVVATKFAQHPDLQRKLLETGSANLIEGNTWNDKFWGVCDGVGENWLGLILMSVRGKLKAGVEL